MSIMLPPASWSSSSSRPKIPKEISKEPMALPIGDYLYRIHDSSNGIDFAHSYSYCSHSDLYCFRYRVLSVTQCGVWIELIGKGKKFVMLDACKKFACENFDRARESFLSRKSRQIRIMESRMENIRKSIGSVGGSKFEAFRVFNV